MSNSVTVVSAFFDLTKREVSQRKSIEVYLKKGEFLSGQDVNLIIFTDPELVPTITEMRNRSELKVKTRVIGVDLLSLPYFDLLPRYLEYRKMNPVGHANESSKDTGLFILLTWNKITFLSRAMKENPFHSTHFAWCDFAISYVADTTNCQTAFRHCPDKIKYLSIRAYDSTVYNVKQYFSRLRWNFAGGFFSGPQLLLQHFITIFTNFVPFLIQLKIIPSEEQIFGYIAYHNHELFDFYVGDYKGILTNYTYLINNVEWVQVYILESLNQKDYIRAHHVKEIFMGSVQADEYHGTWEQLFTTYILCVKAQYHYDVLHKRGADEAKAILAEFHELIEENRELQELERKNEALLSNIL